MTKPTQQQLDIIRDCAKSPNPYLRGLNDQFQRVGYLLPGQWECALDLLRGEGSVLGIIPKLPNTVTRQQQYRWLPEPEGLFPYQREGVEWLRSQKNALLADDMGLGKTIQALAGFIPLDAAVLIFTPLAAQEVWVREIKKWGLPFTPQVIKQKRHMRMPKPGEVLVTNYAKLWNLRDDSAPEPPNGKTAVWLEDAIKEMPANLHIIADECHELKGTAAATQKVRKWRKFSMMARHSGARILGISGTPALNNLSELWRVLVALGCEKPAFRHYGEFCRIAGLEPRGGFQVGPPDKKTLKERLSKVMLRRTREEVFTQMPKKLRHKVRVAIPEELSDQLTEIWEKFELWKYETPEDFAKALWAQGGLEVMSKIKAALAAAKLPHILQLAEEFEESGAPFVVVSSHKTPVEKLGARPGWGCITGDTPAHVRGEVEDKFARGELKAVAITLKAGGVGISLTRANTLIMGDLDWTPGLNKQAEDRLRPHLQREACHYYYVLADHPLEDHILGVISRKEKLLGNVL